MSEVKEIDMLAEKILHDMEVLRLEEYFHNQKWTENEVWNKTQYCGSLKEATHVLALKLLEEAKISTGFYTRAYKLIDEGFGRGWK